MLFDRILIYGAGGFAREINAICDIVGIKVLGFLDERPEMKGQIIDGIPVLGDITDVKYCPVIDGVVVGVGDTKLRKRLAEKVKENGWPLARPIIYPGTVLSKTSKVGRGSVICPGTSITVNVSIGECVMVNQLCSIGHDAVLEDYVTVSPGCNISGNVVVGKGAYIGTGSSIREKLVVGSWSVVGGGAFVRSNVPDDVLVVGVPAVVKGLAK